MAASGVPVTMTGTMTLTGTNTGTLMGIPAKNQKINLKGMSFVRIKDGKIIYKADYYDAATLNKQLGWQ